jgi:hypothetical protein
MLERPARDIRYCQSVYLFICLFVAKKKVYNIACRSELSGLELGTLFYLGIWCQYYYTNLYFLVTHADRK